MNSTVNSTILNGTTAGDAAAAANYEDLNTFKYYSEGILLTPISAFGILGEGYLFL